MHPWDYLRKSKRKFSCQIKSKEQTLKKILSSLNMLNKINFLKDNMHSYTNTTSG